MDPRTPCLIGAAQRTWRGEDDAPEPLEMWTTVARAAAHDADAPSAVSGVDSIDVVHCLSWPYDDPPGRLAERLGAPSGRRRSANMGGESPLLLAGEACDAIARGEADLALVVSGEALATRRRAKRQERRLAWSHRMEGRPPIAMDVFPHPSELAHGALQAYLTFPLFDSARRARLGVPLDAYRADLGRLLARMTEVAAENPHAWFPVARSASEIVEPTEDNRLVAYPYTKYMVAVMDVDMAGALLLASHDRADRLGVPPERRVYLRGWAAGAESAYPAAREDLSRSPAIEAVSAAALTAAGVGIDDIAHLDLYSCFSSSVLLACDALGIEADDPRGVTVTGGLPYAGGPASGYVVHSIAALAERLRDDLGAFGLVSGVGMHMTKHAYGVWSAEPGTFAPFDAAVRRQLASNDGRELRDSADGPATVAAYTVSHDRGGDPEWGLAVCELDDGARCYARIADEQLLADAEREELVGARVLLEPGPDDTNLVVEH